MNIDIEEQIKIFRRATHFVTIGGANLINIIFMNKDAKVLDIYIAEIKSWAVRYGTHKCIKSYRFIKADQYKINTNFKSGKFSSQASNNHIIINDNLINKIKIIFFI